ncbi:MAG: hypothetical protein QOI88_2310 [Gammaproteobacteria bacterium]|jgi:hypothetical protein|nr:hypothetical protein [Gammaproteobacteria bacterium]
MDELNDFIGKLIGDREVMREQITKGRSGGSNFASGHGSVGTGIHHAADQESAQLPLQSRTSSAHYLEGLTPRDMR